MAQIDTLLKKMVRAKASDLHFSQGEPVRMRIYGNLEVATDRPLEKEQVTDVLREICREDLWQTFQQGQEIDFAYALKEIGRFRCNYFRHLRGLGAVFRVIPEKVIPLEELGLPSSIERFAEFKRGLVLVTGPTGSGKSTTMASIINRLNETQALHIITIEDPIEFVHQSKKSYIVQREVGIHTLSSTMALSDALTEDPDVALVGELRDLETISLAINAAEMGILVFGTLHTNSAAKTIDRLIDVFPAARKEEIRNMLSESLVAIASQQLVRKRNQKGQIVAMEILLAGAGFSNIVREGSASKIHSYILSNKAQGMVSLDESLMKLVEQEVVSAKDAFLKASNKVEFEEWLKEKEIELEI